MGIVPAYLSVNAISLLSGTTSACHTHQRTGIKRKNRNFVFEINRLPSRIFLAAGRIVVFGFVIASNASGSIYFQQCCVMDFTFSISHTVKIFFGARAAVTNTKSRLSIAFDLGLLDRK